LDTESGIIYEQKEIANHIVEYYKSLFGSSPNPGVHISADFWCLEEQLDEHDRDMLQSHFSKKDLELVVQGMKVEFAPRPNGFTVYFFRKLWKQVKEELLRMVLDFNNNSLDLKRLNYGVVTLVPKCLEANTIKQYRPICLLNVDFKTFTKMLTDRISPLADKVISPNQTAFIQGRNILEGVVILHEVVHELKRSGKSGVLFKIDFEKAYDKVRWSFVEEVMREKGFPSSWIRQTMDTI
jgi:hypothetical protein